MSFFDMFRREAPIQASDALAEFIDAQAVFLAQKGIYEYLRARTGPHANVLFSEE